MAGVVLFNYAFSVTVPSWLNEKRSDVSVNQTIWGASAVCSVVFITFGLLAATVFERPGANVLVVLSSLKMHSLTRFVLLTLACYFVLWFFFFHLLTSTSPPSLTTWCWSWSCSTSTHGLVPGSVRPFSEWPSLVVVLPSSVSLSKPLCMLHALAMDDGHSLLGQCCHTACHGWCIRAQRSSRCSIGPVW